jgi:hypothetical protein
MVCLDREQIVRLSLGYSIIDRAMYSEPPLTTAVALACLIGTDGPDIITIRPKRLSPAGDPQAL